MHSQRETNPHFLSHLPTDPQLPPHHPGRILQPSGPRISPGDQYTTPRHDHFPLATQPRPAIQPKTRTHGKHSGRKPPPVIHQGRNDDHFGQHGGDPELQSRQQTGRPHVDPHGERPSSLRMTAPRKTRPLAWIIAAVCTLFWIIVIVGGLTVLIVYLIYRPRLPKFDVSSATLNAAYLDMGYLLNADLTLLGNFTNPNKKVNVEFSFVLIDLYFEQSLIATRYVEPFTAFRGQPIFEDIHMVTSQVRLSMTQSEDLRRQISNGRVTFDVKGLFRATSKLGGVLKYSYWLYSHCTISVTGPPTGVLISKKCTTKR